MQSVTASLSPPRADPMHIDSDPTVELKREIEDLKRQLRLRTVFLGPPIEGPGSSQPGEPPLIHQLYRLIEKSRIDLDKRVMSLQIQNMSLLRYMQNADARLRQALIDNDKLREDNATLTKRIKAMESAIAQKKS